MQLTYAPVGGIDFVSTTLDAAVEDLVHLARSREERRGIPVRLMNAYCVALASSDPRYRELVTGSGLNFPDGTPVSWVMRRCGFPESGQVRGPSLFEEVIDRGRVAGVRHYFFGTTNETLDKLVTALEERFPGLEIAGRSDAPFATPEAIVTPELIEMIRTARPDLVWIGLGTPKQDYVGALLADALGVPCLSVGAAFDFSAGTQPIANPWFREHGLEWLHRFASEPRRLGKRYVWGNSRFIAVTAPQVLSAFRASRSRGRAA